MAPKGKEPAERKRMTYSENMKVTLLSLVVQTGAHLASGQAATTKWAEVYTGFFADAEVAPYKETFYKVDSKGAVQSRSLRDKYSDIMITVQGDIETGNQSGKEGDLSRLYELVQQINTDINVNEESKKFKKDGIVADKELLEKNEAEILNGKKGQKNKNSTATVYNADGTVSHDEERAKRKAARMASNVTGFEAKLFEYMEKDSASSSSTNTVSDNLAYFSGIEEKMQKWCAVNDYTLYNLLTDAFAPTKRPYPESCYEALEAIGGLECVISFFCSPDGKFEPKEFAAMMKTFSLENVLHARFLYLALNKLRLKACAVNSAVSTPAMALSTTPEAPPTISSSGSSSSSSSSSGQQQGLVERNMGILAPDCPDTYHYDNFGVDFGTSN